MEARVFVGSSTEGRPVAHALQAGLDDLDGTADVTVWDQDVFRPNRFVLEALLARLDETDFGVFVFTPDDVVRMRGEEEAAARDNVLFELGLFAGRLGRDACCVVTPRGDDAPRLPSDLTGLIPVRYNARRRDGNLRAALGPACREIEDLIDAALAAQRPVPDELRSDFTARRDGLTSRQRKLLRLIQRQEAWTVTELAAAFRTPGDSELHYRLVQLHLLGFVAYDGEDVVELSPAYRRQRSLGSLAGSARPR